MAENMLGIRAPANLPSLVKAAFEKARAAGDLTYYPTQVAILKPRPGLTFQLRFSRALASKPKPSPSNDDDKEKKQQKKPFNPFENPLPSMTIAQLPPSHVLVLNKFAIVPEHFILATSAVKPQTHVLEADDVAAAYACIQAYHEAAAGADDHGDRELFAFFNSGPHSGASQPHRHIQLLPVAQMRAGLDAADRGSDWGVLVDALSARRPVAGGGGYKVADGMPFAVLTERIEPEGATAAELHAAYVRLYREAVRMLCPPDKESGEDDEIPGEGEARISYNLAMTQTTMALCPRVAEGATIRGKSGEEVGSVALNGTVLAGTALVKNEAEWDALRENPANLLEVLSKIGVSSATGSATGSSL
ncbi:HIT-like domain-containing protein [Apiospora kogelbergensis]|uniref:HIT-like domain-containing protein n=1 Tax=Apiospora kogelbergensis TaxID=1337665 RepID=A0AAW0RDG3_9PEZI